MGISRVPGFLMGGLVGFRRACSARSGHGLLWVKFIGKSAGTNRSEVAARRDATSAPEKPNKTGPIKNLAAGKSLVPGNHALAGPAKFY